MRARAAPAFRRGEPLTVEIAAAEATSIRLHYRHVNQAEAYVVTDMLAQDGRYTATIPSDYTDSPYPLQYFFELHDAEGRACFYPGFDANLSNQPYYVVRQKGECQ